MPFSSSAPPQFSRIYFGFLEKSLRALWALLSFHFGYLAQMDASFNLSDLSLVLVGNPDCQQVCDGTWNLDMDLIIVLNAFFTSFLEDGSSIRSQTIDDATTVHGDRVKMLVSSCDHHPPSLPDSVPGVMSQSHVLISQVVYIPT